MEGDSPLLLEVLVYDVMLYLLHFICKRADLENKKLARGSKWQNLYLYEVKRAQTRRFATTYIASHNSNLYQALYRALYTLQKNSHTTSSA